MGDVGMERNEDGEITVQDLHPQGSAARAGLKVGVGRDEA